MSTIKPTKLPESNERLADGLCAAFQCGIITIDGQDRISLVSEVATRILSLMDPRPQTLQDLPAELQTLIAEARSSGKALLDHSVHLGESAHGTLNLRINVLPTGLDKTSLPVTIVFQDLDADRKLEKSLQQLDRLATFGTLSAGIAHEIKNALVVGKTFFDLLLEKDPDAELVQLVRRELKRIELLVTQMVRYNTPAKPTFTEVQLHEVLNHSLLMVERQLKDKSIQLERVYSAPSDRVQGDDFQLEQAFVNLLLNAAEAMTPHGRLTVATRAEFKQDVHVASKQAGRLEITIQDTGTGISPENIERLFNPFFTTKIAGTGLGLSITRRIIEQHGGIITVQSQLDAGTCFHILLPSLNSI